MQTVTHRRDKSGHTPTDRLVLYFAATERLLIAADEVRSASKALLKSSESDDRTSEGSEVSHHAE